MGASAAIGGLPAQGMSSGAPTSTPTSGNKGPGTTTQPSYQQPSYQQPSYQQPMYQQPMYNPMGGNTGMTGGNAFTTSQGYNNPQGINAIQQPMYQQQQPMYQQQQPMYQQTPYGFQPQMQQPMGGGKGGAQMQQPAPQPMQTSAPGGKGGAQMQQPAPVDTSGTAAPGGKGGMPSTPAAPSTGMPTQQLGQMSNLFSQLPTSTTSAAPMTGNTSTYDPATQTYTTGPAI